MAVRYDWETIRAEFEAGDKTEESFAALAEEYSEDTGSNTNGGLYDSTNKVQVSPTQLILGGCTVSSANKPVHLLNLSGDASATAGNLYKIHGNFSNVFYLDGHAESIQEADLNKRSYPKVSGEGAEKVAATYKFLTE